jgi:hypothetical protein
MAEYHVFYIDRGPEFDFSKDILEEVASPVTVVDTMFEIFWLSTQMTGLVNNRPSVSVGY